MPSLQASTIMDLISSVTWASVNVPNYINLSFRTVLPSQEILSEMLCAAGLDFCPGLFKVLISDAPPPSKWFESLPPFVPLKTWGVYVLVLRQNGQDPLLYIGSGTQADRGVRARLSNYESGVNIPRYIDNALKDG